MTPRWLTPQCQPPCQPKFPMEKMFRYHGLHIVASPYYFYEKYKVLTAKGTVRASVGDWLLLMHKSSLRSGVWKGTIEFRQKNASKLAFMGNVRQRLTRPIRASKTRSGDIIPEIWVPD